MKKLLCLLLALMMIFTFAACDTKEPADDTSDSSTTESTTENTEPASETPAVDAKPVNYFTISLSDGAETMSMTAQDYGDGTAYVEYNGDVKKRGQLDASVLEGLAEALAVSGLPALNEQSVYEEGDASASFYVTYADESYLMADFGGTIPQEFITGLFAMETYFQSATADMEEYVPQPEVMDGVNEDALNALMAILNASAIDNVDTYSISDIALDENFSAISGLSSADGVISGTICQAMMMTDAYSMVVVTIENVDSIGDYCNDFADNMAWRKWVCVSPESALVAVNGNMVLCLMGSDPVFTNTSNAMEANGWEIVRILENPDLA